jgi:plasmid maintenance system killer protein
MKRILAEVLFQPPPSLSNTLSWMRPEVKDVPSITISFNWRLIFEIESLLHILPVQTIFFINRA